MYRSLFFTTALIGTNMALVQQISTAKSTVEVEQIAKAITVQINAVGKEHSGSGILLQQQGNIYTVLTTRRVVSIGDTFTIKTSDGQFHQAIPGSVRSANKTDLAVVKFRSTNSYALTKIGTSNSLQDASLLYVAGFSKQNNGIEANTANFIEGRVTGKATRTLSDGYSLVYNNNTLQGMDGGALLNEAGELVGIHGRGDNNSATNNSSQRNLIRIKSGFNLGIVVEQLGIVALQMGVQLDQPIATLPQGQALNATDYLLGGYDRGDTAIQRPTALAKSPLEVGRVAKAITVEIKKVGTDKSGSGILLQRQGDVYTVLTAGHVVDKEAVFTLKTADGKIHRSIADSVKFSGNNIDLGILKFRASQNYTLAKIGTSNSLEPLSPIYVAGFPESTYAIEAGTLNITEGKVVGNATKGNARGYSLFYSNTTLRGMSGGPVLNEAGELVAIHGQGDREGKEGEGEKTGRNLGIVVERFGTVALTMGVQIDQQIAALPQNKSPNASDYFLSAISKDERRDYQGALADFNRSISLNPQYSLGYYNRALLKYQRLNDVQGALSDYNQAILLNPKYSLAYHNRALLKYLKLNDREEAVQDFRQAARLFREQGNNPNLQLAIKALRQLGATE
jgi:S1-C subfamily serine protease